MSKKHKTNRNMKNDSSFMGVALFPVRKIHLAQCGYALCMPVSKWLNTRRMEDRPSRIPSDQGTCILRIHKLKKLWVYLLSPSAVRSHGTILTNMYSKKKFTRRREVPFCWLRVSLAHRSPFNQLSMQMHSSLRIPPAWWHMRQNGSHFGIN